MSKSKGNKVDLEAYRHSVAHLLAAAVMGLYPDTKRAIGPAIENGFYYDFEFSKPISEDDLPKIEKKMRQILPTWDKFERKEANKEEAKKEFKDNSYKKELIDEFSKEKKKLTLYKSGNYVDLCKGCHVASMKDVKVDSFRLTHIAGAYWRGDEKNKQLTRIYGLAFSTKKELDEYIGMQAEAKKRDHRLLGKKLDLFSFHELSPGSPFFHPRGTIIFLELQKFLREQYKSWGYQEVITPLIYSKELWEQSGHWEHFREEMFDVSMDDKEAALKPMNCPSHILIFKTQSRSYRDLPMRIADFAPIHRNELKGVLGGLTRVRKFSQDDCHVFCTSEQVKDEVKKLINNVKFVYSKVFDFDFQVELSTKPEKAMGDPKQWEYAENALRKALEENKVKYKLNPGEGAFYGPKIDFHIKDSLGRSWQCGTEQLDFQQPEKFNIEYEGSDGKKHRAIMLHRTVLGSLERFMAILIEHYAGKFPLWLAPEQVRIVTVSDKFDEYADEVAEKLRKNNVRVEVDKRAESIPKKVREAQVQYVPLIVTVGEKEAGTDTVAVRTLDGKVKFGMKVDNFILKVTSIVESREITIDI
ncbi:threonine--tRNA ligase [archaeon AH-315-M20]|nr:threonine--tRNA ligase [archaeon AH-315-M20]